MVEMIIFTERISQNSGRHHGASPMVVSINVPTCLAVIRNGRFIGRLEKSANTIIQSLS